MGYYKATYLELCVIIAGVVELMKIVGTQRTSYVSRHFYCEKLNSYEYLIILWAMV